MTESDVACTFLINYDKGTIPTVADFQKRFEKAASVTQKDSQMLIETLKELLLLMSNGEAYPSLLMTIIRFAVPSHDHIVKKLVMLYWELCEKTRPDDKAELREEMILVCNALRNDLMHPNEYVRGATLRLLCKMRYYKIMQPLMDAVLRNLSHRHSYVRRNAVMCVYSIVKSFGIDALPQGPEEIHQLLMVEGDLSTKRNAFVMLSHCEQERAMQYVESLEDQIPNQGDIMQLALVDLIRKACIDDSAFTSQYLPVLYGLAGSGNAGVNYEVSSSLVCLSGSPMAIQTACQGYVQLLNSQPDNNVKLIVLDRLAELRKNHRSILESFVMDILRALSSLSLEIRKKVLDIVLSGCGLVSTRNVSSVIAVFQKEIVRTSDAEGGGVEGTTEYRRLLIKAVHAIFSKFPSLPETEAVMFLLMDFLSENDVQTASEVVSFLKELIWEQPPLRAAILSKLSDGIGEVQHSRTIRGCLWLLGEFAEEEELVESAVNSIIEALKPLPISSKSDVSALKAKKKEEDSAQEGVKMHTKTVILADGSYGTQNVYEGVQENTGDAKSSPLRSLLVSRDHHLASLIGVTLSKLYLKMVDRSPPPPLVTNQILFILANLIKLCRQGGEEDAEGKQPRKLAATNAASGRLMQCLKAVATPEKGKGAEWGPGGKDMLKQVEKKEKGAGSTATVDEEAGLFQSGGSGESKKGKLGDSEIFAERLQKAVAMTGLADPVYVEGFLQVHSFDLLLELNVINRTAETLQNVLVEIATHGDLKLVDRPHSVTLSPGESAILHASIKVSSTETGVIFGSLSFEKKSSLDKEQLILNELQVDILDYIEKGWVAEMAFRGMWMEFEWENKINVSCGQIEPREFLSEIMKSTNMSIVGRPQSVALPSLQSLSARQRKTLTDEDVEAQISESMVVKKLLGRTSFLATNLYAKSIFGEDALANLSLEKQGEGKLSGCVRIRARTQGIALSLGDRITAVQRQMAQKVANSKKF